MQRIISEFGITFAIIGALISTIVAFSSVVFTFYYARRTRSLEMQMHRLAAKDRELALSPDVSEMPESPELDEEVDHDG